MNFWLNKQRSKSSKAAVYLRLTIANRRVEIATQQYINPTHWDPEMEIHCWTTRDAEGINAKLIIVKTEVKKHYDRLTALGKLVTAEMVKNEYLGIGVTEKTHGNTRLATANFIIFMVTYTFRINFQSESILTC